jgi:hypothetical protein
LLEIHTGDLEQALANHNEADELRAHLVLGDTQLDYKHPKIAHTHFARALDLATKQQSIKVLELFIFSSGVMHVD